MQLFFTFKTPQGDEYGDCLYGIEIEPLLDVLEYFAGAGYQLLSAQLYDEAGKRTDLAVEAFDGKLIGNQLKELQLEYELVLTP